MQPRTRSLKLTVFCLAAVAAAWLPGPPVPAQVADVEPAFLGVQLREATERAEGGAQVTHVVEGSPADEAGLLAGDVVVEFEGAPIRGPLALTQRIHTKRPGDRVAVIVVREGERESLEIELGRRTRGTTMRWETPAPPYVEPAPAPIPDGPRITEPVEPPVPAAPDIEFVLPNDLNERVERESRALSRYLESLRWGDKPRLGVELVETTPELREHLGGSADAGVLVSKILSGMPAEKAGLEVGDLILSVDGESVASSSELIQALRDKPGRTFPIEVVRDHETRNIEVTIPEPQPDQPTGPRA